MKKLSFLNLILAISILYGCGGPHLTESESTISSSDKIEIKEILKEENALTKNLISITNNEGESLLNFGNIPEALEISKILTVTNKSTQELTLSFKFQSGSAYSFSAGVYPGINGTCKEKIKAAEICLLEITFQPNISGIFEDLLVLTLNSEMNVSIPISGERKANKNNSNENTSKIILTENSLGTTLFFNNIPVGSNITREIELNNTSDKNINIQEIKILNEEAFKIIDLGSCQKIFAPGTCKINISFNPNDVKTFQTELLVRDTEENKLTLKLSGNGIIQPTCTLKSETIHKPSIKRTLKIENSTLPYLSSSPKTRSKLSQLYGTDFNIQIKGVSIRTVEDAQVLIEYRLKKMDTQHINDITIDLDVWKIINDNYKDTEILCLSSKNIKRCSGRPFTLASWRQLMNPNFWTSDSVMAGSLFEDKLGKFEKKCGDKFCEVLRREISFKQMFNLTSEELKNLVKEQAFFIILADDSRFLSLPQLKIKSEQSTSCEHY